MASETFSTYAYVILASIILCNKMLADIRR